MGNCFSQKQHHRLITDSNSQKTQGSLDFDILIENIKIKMDIQNPCKVQMEIADYLCFETDFEMENQGQFYFKSQMQLQIHATEEELRKKFITIKIVNDKQESLSQFLILLYEIATGPYHLDYQFIAQNSKKKGKISFDFKMAQIITIKIIPKLIDFQMLEPLNYKAYQFQLKVITSQMQFQSEFSSVFLNPLFQKGQSNVATKQIIWNNSQVEMEIEVPLIEIVSSSLQICLFHNTNDGQYELLSQSNVNLNYAINQTKQSDQISYQGRKAYRAQYQQNNRRVWNHGIQEGTINYHLEVIVPVHLKQQIVGVRTDKGVSQGTRIINESKISLKEIQQLSQMSKQLIDNQYQSFVDNTKEEIQNEYDKTAKKMIETLKLSHKQSMVCFEYKNQGDLFNTQKLLIDLALKIIETADQQQEQLREDYYCILKLILARGELSLSQLGFTEETQKTDEKLLRLKLDIAYNFQSFLQKALSRTLEKLKQKSIANNEREFVEYFFANAYFRIPEFRNKIINSIQRSDDPQIPEWRSLTKQQRGIPNIEFNDIFDWNKHFYDHMTKDPRYFVNNHKINESINSTILSQRMGKRGVAFFLFVKEWSDLLDDYIKQKKNVPYHQLPGYFQLVKAVLLEIKTRELYNYPEAMKLALGSLLRNNELLNIFLILIFNKVNLYNSNDVVLCLELVNYLLKQIQNHQQQIPTSFDQKVFLKVIRIILNESDHSQCISKCLLMIYDNYQLFPLDIKKELCDLIFDKLAIRLFIHWSYNVRMVFHYFLVYRIFHQHKSHIERDIDEDLLLSKYQQQVLPKKQHSYFDQKNQSKQIISDFIYLKYLRYMKQIEEGRHLQFNKIGGTQNEIETSNYIDHLKKKLIHLKKNQEYQNVESHSFKIIYDRKISDTILPKEIENQNESNLKSQNSQYLINNIQFKYFQKSCGEYDQIIIQYQKWRQNNLPTNSNSLSEEQIFNVIESLQVPPVNLPIITDEREISNKGDEW